MLNEKNGHILSGGADCKVKLWDVNKGICLKEFTGHTRNNFFKTNMHEKFFVELIKTL